MCVTICGNDFSDTLHTGNREYFVIVHTPLSREVFWHEYAKIPRHTSQNSIAAGNLEWILATLLWTEWTVTLMPNIKGKYTRIVLTFLLKCDKKRISELNMCNVITQRLHRTWCAKENPVRIRSDTVTVYGSCFSETTGKLGREKQRWSKSGELPWRRI